MPLTLSEVFTHPHRVTYPLDLPGVGAAWLRPLQFDDVDGLTTFLSGLSPQTRRFSLFPSYDRKGAQGLCEAINRYDKLRFVVELSPSKVLIGLFEFSFGIPEGDLQRFARYGVHLDEDNDCRFGPTLADAYQDQRIGSIAFPHLVDVATRFGKKRIILWGGVLGDNARAIRFYEKQGFRQTGTFVDHEGLQVCDMILRLAEQK
ncbi:MAG: GNAT family N-acetyltransferase [Caldilineaceae bacterium]|nr:GNAT family N-acetyltransferase [Caldilineaceae bacterium]